MTCTRGAAIIAKAESVGLDLRVLYEAVIDLSSEGLLTANCLNLAAGILLQDLGLPRYFFQNINKVPLANLLQSIATIVKVVDGRIDACTAGSPRSISMPPSPGMVQWVRIATEETPGQHGDSARTRSSPVIAASTIISPESSYYTYIIRPETVADYSRRAFDNSRFLFTLAGDYHVTPSRRGRRYEKFLNESEAIAHPADRGVQPAGERRDPADVQLRFRLAAAAGAAEDSRQTTA